MSKVEVFRNNFLDNNNKFRDFKDIDPNIKLGFTKLLGKSGKYAFASHIKNFLLPGEANGTIVNKLEEIAAPIKAKIVGDKITGRGGIDTNISEFLDIKDCFKLNNVEKKKPEAQSRTFAERVRGQAERNRTGGHSR